MICPHCKKDFCFNCMCEYHEGMTCDEYVKWKKDNSEGDQKFMDWIKQNGAICPKCKMACQKLSGCNWIYCHPAVCGCGCGYCYVCGEEVDHYSPHILQANCNLSKKQGK